MPKFVFDFDGVDMENKYELIPVGIYEFRIDTSETQAETSAAGNTKFSVCFVTQNNSQHNGRKIYETFTQNKKALWKVGQLVKAIGLLQDGQTKLNTDTKAWHGKSVLGQVKHEIYNEQQRAKIVAFFPVEQSSNSQNSVEF